MVEEICLEETAELHKESDNITDDIHTVGAFVTAASHISYNSEMFPQAMVRPGDQAFVSCNIFPRSQLHSLTLVMKVCAFRRRLLGLFLMYYVAI